MEADIIKIIERYVENGEKVNLKSYLVEELCIDSLNRMQIICDIEDKYQIEIPYSELENVLTVEDFIKCIEGKKYNGNEVL